MARKRKRGQRYRRGRFGFLYVLLSFLLILAAVLAGSFIFFRVDVITVEGNSRYSREEVIAASGVAPGDNLFALNGHTVAERIHAALPYVRESTIERDLPSGLVLRVTESQPAASLRTSEGWCLIDARGKLVELGEDGLKGRAAQVTGLSVLEPVVGLRIQVEEEQQTKLDALTQILTAMEARSMLSGLDYAKLTSSNLVELGYLDRFTVQLPLSCDFSYKIQALEYVVSMLEENETGLIDLTRSDKTHFIPED